jgi:hypothetical protein
MKKYKSKGLLIPATGIILISFFSAAGIIKHQNEDMTKPEIPHIQSIEINNIQPQENDPDVIWYDDFKNERLYHESLGEIDGTESFGSGSGSMKAGFRKGEINGDGKRNLAFGDFPEGTNIVRKGEHFDEIYWRIYVKHEYGWEGVPAKMSRATSIVSEKWQQAMIVHVWSGEANSITLDPASGVKGQSDSILTGKYNDFDNLRWLGNKPCSAFQISSGDESGYWVLVEASAKLNTPGLSDGSCRLWIDGRLEAERTKLNLRGSYTRHGINAVFLESYWNGGASKTEGRWFDNFVVSTKPIGPVTCPVNPALYKTPYHGSGQQESWEVELATDFTGSEIVYKSRVQGKNTSLTINPETGTFTGNLSGKKHLTTGVTYFCRIRQKGSGTAWSAWSRWHQPFKVSVDYSAIR